MIDNNNNIFECAIYRTIQRNDVMEYTRCNRSWYRRVDIMSIKKKTIKTSRWFVIYRARTRHLSCSDSSIPIILKTDSSISNIENDQYVQRSRFTRFTRRHFWYTMHWFGQYLQVDISMNEVLCVWRGNVIWWSWMNYQVLFFKNAFIYIYIYIYQLRRHITVTMKYVSLSKGIIDCKIIRRTIWRWREVRNPTLNQHLYYIHYYIYIRNHVLLCFGNTESQTTECHDYERYK